MNLNIYVTLKFESMTTFFLYHVKWKKCFLQENMFYLISRFSLTSNQKSLVFRGTEALSDIVNVFVPAQKLFGIVRVLTNFSFIRLTDHFLLFFPSIQIDAGCSQQTCYVFWNWLFLYTKGIINLTLVIKIHETLFFG